jgi:hypothetical protein
MSPRSSIAALCIFLAVFIELRCLFSYFRSLRSKAYAKGFEDGKLAANNYWIRIEKEVDQIRLERWREEPKEGRWP